MKDLKFVVIAGALFSLLLLSSQAMASHKDDNPLEAKEAQCAVWDKVAAYKGGNPCEAKNPCGVNPCAPKQPCQPCAPSAQPCGAGKMMIKPIRAEKVKGLEDAIKYGEKLWNDPSLGKTGLSCNSCHEGGKTFNKSFAKPYPHYVKMPDDVVTLDQMINFCMLNPMKGSPLDWNSKEMTALAAYIQHVVAKGVMGKNPCGAKNPCAVK